MWNRIISWLGFHKKDKKEDCPGNNKGHMLEWDPNGKRLLIPATSIQSWTCLETKLKCHYCDYTCGPQKGKSVFEE